MNKTELRTALTTLGVPSRTYSLSGSPSDERLCLLGDAGAWRVSFFERGQERLMGTFDTEAAACEFMLSELKHEV